MLSIPMAGKKNWSSKEGGGRSESEISETRIEKKDKWFMILPLQMQKTVEDIRFRLERGHE